MTPGHELVGIIDQLSTGATRFAPGEQVAVNPNVHCGYCTYCLAGRLVRCENARGHGVNAPGFFAEYVTVGSTLVFSVDGLDRDTTVFTEPAACAMHGLETLNLRPGSSVLILGAGPTGVLVARLVVNGGASSVTVAGPTQFKLDTEAALGIDKIVRIDRDGTDATVPALRAASPAGRRLQRGHRSHRRNHHRRDVRSTDS